MEGLLGKEVAGHRVCTASTHLSPDHLPLHFGSHSVSNWEIAKRFCEDSQAYSGLKGDWLTLNVISVLAVQIKPTWAM